MNFLFPNSRKNQLNIYSCDVLEGNWYQDRCVTDYDKRKKKEILLPSPNSWQYETNYNQIGQNYKTIPKLKERFSECQDDVINNGEKDYKMYITTTKHSLDPKYKETFMQKASSKDYFKAKPEELNE